MRSNQLSRPGFWLFTILVSLPVVAQTYTFQTFHVPYPPDNGTNGLGINNRGAIVGRMTFRHRINGFPGQAIRGFKHDVDGVYEYPVIAPQDNAYVTETLGINDSGVIVGRCFDTSNNYHGFLYSNGAFTAVDPYGAASVWVTGINNAGDFVGSYGQSYVPTNGFVSRNGVISQVAFPGAQATIPFGIGEDGTTVGTAGTYNATWLFIMGPKGNFRRFRIAGATIQSAQGVNSEAHLIVGYYYDQSSVEHGFTYDYLSQSAMDVPDGAEVSVNTVDYPGGAFTQIEGVNAKGQIVGSSQLATGPAFAFIGTPAP